MTPKSFLYRQGAKFKYFLVLVGSAVFSIKILASMLCKLPAFSADWPALLLPAALSCTDFMP